MIQAKQPNLKLKFYADTPAGQKNKYFVFKVKSYDHAIDLAAKFVQDQGFIMRAAYFQVLDGVSRRFDKEFDLNRRVCSQIEQNDIEQLLSIEKQDTDTRNQELYLDSLRSEHLDSNKKG